MREISAKCVSKHALGKFCQLNLTTLEHKYRSSFESVLAEISGIVSEFCFLQQLPWYCIATVAFQLFYVKNNIKLECE